ncbi:MAG: cohesin domain-containing protein [Candidatus Gottesmanbacteria bacterium]
MKRILFTLILIFFITGFISVNKAYAARYGLSPTTKSLNVGDTFSVTISLDTDNKNVSNIQATLNFSKDLIENTGINFADLFPKNFKLIDNNLGSTKIGSGKDLQATFYKGSGDWVTLDFKAKAAGQATIAFVCLDSGILELGVEGNLLDCNALPSGTYSISELGVVASPASTPPSNGSNNNNSSGTNNTSPGSYSCNDTQPGTPTNLTATSGPNNGQVTLGWTKATNADYYSLAFGTASKKYDYGAVNIGNGNSYKVSGLAPNTLYYFAITAVHGCASSGFSQEASARAKGIASGTTGTKKSTPVPSTPPYKPAFEVFPKLITQSPALLTSPIPTVSLKPTPSPIVSDAVISEILKGTIIISSIILVGVLIGLLLIKQQKPKPPIFVDLTNESPTKE